MRLQAPAKNLDHASLLQTDSSARYIPFILIAVTLLCLFPVCTHDFVEWDDWQNITHNPDLNPPSWHGLFQFWSFSYQWGFLPLTYTVWSGLASISRLETPDLYGATLNPYVFHVANLLVHTGSVLIVYQLLKRLTRRPWPSAAGALVFAIHPLQVEPVAWATGMKDMLAGVFSFTALLCYVIAAQKNKPTSEIAGVEAGRTKRPQSGRRAAAPAPPPASSHGAWGWWLGATAAFIAALLSKPGTVTIPLLAIVIDRYVLGRPWKKVASASGPWLVLAASSALVTVTFGVWIHAKYVSVPLWIRPLIAADSLAFYLEKVAVPFHLAVLYPQSPNQVRASGQLEITWIIPLVVIAVAWMLRKRIPLLPAAVAIFILSPLPVLGLVNFDHQRYSTVADRYVYVAMLGPALAMAGALAAVQLTWRRLAIAGAASYLAFLGVLSFVQTRYWADSLALFTHVLEVNPGSGMAYSHLSHIALVSDNTAEAERLARNAIELNPDLGFSYVMLGQSLNLQKRYDEERLAYQQGFLHDKEGFTVQVVPLMVDAPPGDPRVKVLRSLFDVGGIKPGAPNLRH